MFIHIPDLLCEICVIYMNSCLRYVRMQYAHISKVRLLLLKENKIMYFCPYNSEY